LVDFKQIREDLTKATDRVYQREEVAYYQDRVYRLIIFEHGAYTILKANGESATAEHVADLRPLVEEALAVMEHIDLREEARAKQRAIEVETALIDRLMLAGGTGTLASLMQMQVQQISEDELRGAAERLRQTGILDSTVDADMSLPTGTDEQGYSRVANTYKALFGIPPPVNVIDCQWYRDHINKELLLTAAQFAQLCLP
jgi:hypothetical protein